MTETAAGVSAVSPEAHPRPRAARRGRAWRVLYGLTILGLIGANVWKVWRDTRPIPEMKAISALLEQGKIDAAEASARELVRESPHYAEPRMVLARILANRNDFAESARFLKDVPFWSPLKSEALWYEASSWLRADRARDAEDAYRRYIAEDPNHPPRPRRVEAEVALINLLTLENRWDETRDVIWKAYDQADPRGREELLVMSLRTFLERSSPKASYQALRRYVAADPTDVEARIALATAAQELGRAAEADAEIARCLRDRPADVKVWKAWLEILKDRPERAELSAAMAKAPAEVSEAMTPYRAAALLHSGDAHAAADAYAKAVELWPHDADLQYRLSLAARRAGRPEVEKQAALKSRALRAARQKLADGLRVFMNDARAPDYTPSRKTAVMNRLADLCRALGLDRDAREWSRLAKGAPE